MLLELNPPVPLNEFHLGGGGGGSLWITNTDCNDRQVVST